MASPDAVWASSSMSTEVMSSSAASTPSGRFIPDSIDPRYAGQLLDVFPGGCVTVDYDFERGRHVALVTELQSAVGLFTRLELRQALAADLDVRLDP